jgi:hypothetical protein
MIAMYLQMQVEIELWIVCVTECVYEVVDVIVDEDVVYVDAANRYKTGEEKK